MGAYKSDDEDDISPNEARAIELEDDQLLSIKAAHFNAETTSPRTSPNLQSTPKETVINLHFFIVYTFLFFTLFYSGHYPCSHMAYICFLFFTLFYTFLYGPLSMFIHGIYLFLFLQINRPLTRAISMKKMHLLLPVIQSPFSDTIGTPVWTSSSIWTF